MDPVPTQYVDRDGAALAYQVVGDGPVDVVVCLEIIQHLDLSWTDPDIHRNLETLGSFSRAVLFQRRGFGLSDQISYTPTIEQQAEDILAVMDEVGMRSATLAGFVGTCGAAALVAANAPERVNGLVLSDPFCQGWGAPGEKHGWTEAEYRNYVEGYRQAFNKWGSGGIASMLDPVLDTPYNRRLMALLERSSATPLTAQSYFEWTQQIDIQDVLRAVQVPTRVLHVPSSPIPEAAVRYAADLVPTSTFHMLPPTPRGASLGRAYQPFIAHIEELATGTVHAPEADRYLGTVLFTDVVSSTEMLARVGDAQYRQTRADHERLVRFAVETAGGRLMTVTGDGTLSVFDGPSAAVRAAEEIRRESEDAGFSVRAGIHTGELERDSMNVTGLAVHIGARVGAAASPGEILVSRTVRDLVAGSGLMFDGRGEQELKGIPGSWELFAVNHAGEQPEDLPLDESMQTPMDRLTLQTARKAPGLMRAALRLGNAIERRRAQ